MYKCSKLFLVCLWHEIEFLLSFAQSKRIYHTIKGKSSHKYLKINTVLQRKYCHSTMKANEALPNFLDLWRC